MSGLDRDARISTPSAGMIRIRFDGLALPLSPAEGLPDTPLRLRLKSRRLVCIGQGQVKCQVGAPSLLFSIRRALSTRCYFAGLNSGELAAGGADGPFLRPDQVPARPIL